MSLRKITVKARAVEGSETFGFASTGTRQIGFNVEVLTGVLSGQTLGWYGFFSDKSAERTLEQCKTAGWVDDDDGWRAFGEGRLPGLGSTEFSLICEEEEEQDENGHVTGTFWRPTFINGSGVAMKDQMDPSQLRAFGAEMRSLFGGGAGGSQRSQQRPQQAQQNQQRNGGFGGGSGQRSAQSQQRGGSFGGGGNAGAQRADDDIPF